MEGKTLIGEEEIETEWLGRSSEVFKLKAQRM